MPKGIKESEAIRIYVLKDKSRPYVWIVETPSDLIKSRSGKKISKKKWCFSPTTLTKRIKELTDLKLSPSIKT